MLTHKARETEHDHKHQEIVVDYEPDNVAIYEKETVIQCLHSSMLTDIVLTGAIHLKFRKKETKKTKLFLIFPCLLQLLQHFYQLFKTIG